ncbi:hypothetical protein HY17_01050 [Hyphomonas sp. CY54-11-8]|nr:hypothetical protein HY17_01050 [Hyphomonas sp. CY54-11-8]
MSLQCSQLRLSDIKFPLPKEELLIDCTQKIRKRIFYSLWNEWITLAVKQTFSASYFILLLKAQK